MSRAFLQPATDHRGAAIISPHPELRPAVIDAEVHRVNKSAIAAGHFVVLLHRLNPARPAIAIQRGRLITIAAHFGLASPHRAHQG